MTWPAVLFWLGIFGSAISSGPALLYLFSIAGCVQTLQMLPGAALGGVNILPQSICAIFIVAKFLMQRGNVVRSLAAACDVKRLALLIAFLIYAVGTAFLLPRLFADQAIVITVNAPITGMSLLRPTSQNYTQVGYMGVSVLIAVVFTVLGTQQSFQRAFTKSILLGGVALIVTGLLDLVTYRLGLGGLLDPFRNTSYELFTDSEALGAKRVVGLMPEASSYGGACVAAASMLAFLRPLFAPRLRRVVVPLITVGLLGMAVISTSSGAYIGLAIFAMAYAANLLIRLTSPTALAREDLGAEILIIVSCVFAVFCVVVLAPALLDPLVQLVDTMIFKKSGTSSYYERNQWTSVAWEALLATHGWGVGLGAVRSSNWYVSVLASTGIIGGLLLFGFMAVQFLVGSGSADPRIGELRRALRFSLLPSLVIAWFSGTIPDIGTASASILGLLASTTRRAASPGSDPAG